MPDIPVLGRSCYRLPYLFLLPLLVALGCSETTTELETARLKADSAVFRTEVDASTGQFATNGDGDAPRGSFIIEGTNIGYDDALGALTADLSVTNGTDADLSENVALTFARLLPDGVTILNSDNGETGSGAQFLLSLPNDDGVWSPEEMSLPRTVQFAVEAGRSVGFIARIDALVDETRGSIGGMVFDDSDADGLMGSEEMGLVGVRIELWAGANLLDGAVTAEDGTYRFDGLDAGLYTVKKPMQEGLQATTASEIQVLLVETEGVVDAFLAANFGCHVLPIDDMPMIEVGDRVHVKGEYHPEKGFVATIVDFECEDEEDHGDHLHGELRGPVTEIDAENFQVAIMGSWVDFSRMHEDDWSEKTGDEDCPRPAHDLELGQRVRARVLLPELEDELLVGLRLKCWNGNRDRLMGVVQALEFNEDDELVGMIVLNTAVDASNAKFERDHDDDEDDEDGDD